MFLCQLMDAQIDSCVYKVSELLTKCQDCSGEWLPRLSTDFIRPWQLGIDKYIRINLQPAKSVINNSVHKVGKVLKTQTWWTVGWVHILRWWLRVLGFSWRNTMIFSRCWSSWTTTFHSWCCTSTCVQHFFLHKYPQKNPFHDSRICHIGNPTHVSKTILSPMKIYEQIIHILQGQGLQCKSLFAGDLEFQGVRIAAAESDLVHAFLW